MVSTKVKVERVDGTELLEPDTYVATFGLKNHPNHYTFAVRKLGKPVHPEVAVHYFAEVLREKGLNPQETWCHVRGLNHKHTVTFAEYVTTESEAAELVPVLKQLHKLSKAEGSQLTRKVNRLTQKGFKK